MSYAKAAAAARGSREVFDDVLRLQHQLHADFTCHDDRQKRFQKTFARETRKHNQAISSMACVINSTPASNAVLFVQDQMALDAVDDSRGSARRGSVVARQLERLKNPNAQRLRASLQAFYLPPIVTTDIVCDACGSFKSSSLINALPPQWEEFVCEESGKRYFYNHESKQVLWTPPPGTSAFSVFVFERTNSIAAVCRCIPSHERRRRCMHKFKTYALDAARAETEKRNRELHGAFKTLAHSVAKKTDFSAQ